MPSLKILEEIMQKLGHEHRFEFFDFDGAASFFRCIITDCPAECVEPEDSGTGA